MFTGPLVLWLSIANTIVLIVSLSYIPLVPMLELNHDVPSLYLFSHMQKSGFLMTRLIYEFIILLRRLCTLELELSNEENDVFAGNLMAEYIRCNEIT